MPPTCPEPEYLLDSGTDLGLEQLQCLELLLDDHTTRALTATGIRSGQHCLEIGAGTGSIARWMADRVRPEGSVLAIDLETSRMTGGPGLEVRQHDLNSGAPTGGPFDLIHGRLVLMHLRRRREIVRELIDTLVPGGWLVLGEFLGPSFDPIAAPSRADADLFHRVVEVTINDLGRPGGISYEWAHEVDAVLIEEGMVNVHTERRIESTSGGETGGILFANYIRQVAPLLIGAGISESELQRFYALTLTPAFRAWMFEHTIVRAQKPR